MYLTRKNLNLCIIIYMIEQGGMNMCTSFIYNGKKTLVGWNLDILDMEYRVHATNQGVYIEIYDQKEGWLPLFGANQRGDFVAMPTCWPYDQRSEPQDNEYNILQLDIDLLLQRISFEDVKRIVASSSICSVPQVTFQSQLSDAQGNVLQIIPGQGFLYKQKPRLSILTNFSPFKGDKEKHPWMGWDRYQTAISLLENSDDSLDVEQCFDILKVTSQTICPTVVSMVFDVNERHVYWCEQRQWNQRKDQQL